MKEWAFYALLYMFFFPTSSSSSFHSFKSLHCWTFFFKQERKKIKKEIIENRKEKEHQKSCRNVAIFHYFETSWIEQRRKTKKINSSLYNFKNIMLRIYFLTSITSWYLYITLFVFPFLLFSRLNRKNRIIKKNIKKRIKIKNNVKIHWNYTCMQIYLFFNNYHLMISRVCNFFLLRFWKK